MEYFDEALMKRLFILDYFRGTDSTGLAAIAATGVPSIVKMATHPINLFDSKAFDKALNGHMCNVFLGHNRAATLGQVNDLNAHPFQYGDIIGAHNGTLDKETWQRLEEAAGITTDVDSAAIFACINEIGIEETVKLMEEGRTSATGAWALVWYDMKDRTLRFLRNEHRPLWYSLDKKGERLVWASEHEMISAATSMTNNWGDLQEDKEGYTFFPFYTDYLYEVPIDTLKSGVTVTEFEAFRTKKLKGKEPVLKPVTTLGKAPFLHAPGGESSTTQSTGTGTTKSPTGSNVKDTKVHLLTPTKEEPFGGAISKKEFEDIAAYGCSYCGADIDIDDAGTTIYLDDNVIICGDCSTSRFGDVRIYMQSTASRTLVN